jgi:hypothetical protein
MRLLPVAAACLLLAPPALRAQTTPVVLELYTSQGCSSCPPADALLTDLAGRDGVIALALHVDYWDYLGWKDTFGSPANTARQRAYARAVRSRTIFTPEMVVQGETPLKGHDAASILREIAQLQKRPATVTLSLDRDGDNLKIHLAPVGSGPGPAEVYLVRYIPSVDVSIGAGENAGRELTYTNIVTDWDKLGRWDGVTPADLRYEGLDGDEATAIIVQLPDMGPVLTAAALP